MFSITIMCKKTQKGWFVKYLIRNIHIVSMRIYVCRSQEALWMLYQTWGCWLQAPCLFSSVCSMYMYMDSLIHLLASTTSSSSIFTLSRETWCFCLPWKCRCCYTSEVQVLGHRCSANLALWCPARFLNVGTPAATIFTDSFTFDLTDHPHLSPPPLLDLPVNTGADRACSWAWRSCPPCVLWRCSCSHVTEWRVTVPPSINLTVIKGQDNWPKALFI